MSWYLGSNLKLLVINKFLMNKRLSQEVKRLMIQQNSKEDLLDNDYLIHINENNVNRIDAIIKAPFDSVYRHKFIKMTFEIPDNYPFSPPVVKFVNFDGVRIHPNMYEDGKCCSTILNTWPSEKERWSPSMGIETVLLTFHSFLDNNPYTFEPGGRDDPSYTVYVQYQSWMTCLIRYLNYETIPEFKTYMQNYVLTHMEEIFDQLHELKLNYPYGTYFSNCFEIDHYVINYDKIIDVMAYYCSFIEYNETINESIFGNEKVQPITFQQFLDNGYTCNICFDTKDNVTNFELACKHTFHQCCLQDHLECNQSLCPMCRFEISKSIVKQIQWKPTELTWSTWTTNPLTKRRIKVGGKTYKLLVEQGVIQ